MIMEKLDTGELDRRQWKLLYTSIFLGKLLFAGAIFQLVLFLYPSTYGIQAWFAGIVSRVLGLLGIQATHTGYFIFLDSGTYQITQDCLGWKSMAAFTGLMYASGPLGKHWRYLFTGIGVLAAANMVRVVSTVYLSHQGIISFDIIHGTLWKWGLTAVVLILWFYWSRNERQETLLMQGQ